MYPSRRAVLGGASLLTLSACSSLTFSNAGVTLEQVKEYADDAVDVITASAQAYLASPSAAAASTVRQVLADLQRARDALDTSTVPENARDVANEVLSFGESIYPILAPFIPAPAAPFVPLAFAVLRAFINSLPLPPQAPPAPPKALHATAMRVRAKGLHRF